VSQQRKSRKMSDRITSSYEHALQACYYHIGNRGICVNVAKIEEAKAIVRAEVSRQLAIATNQWSVEVFVGADDKKPAGSINLNATQGKYALLTGLKTLGYKVETITKKNEDGDYEQSYSTGELAIQKMLSRNQFNYPGGDPALKSILKVRELGKLYSSYLSARLLQQGQQALLLSNYNVAGTLTGRRSSRRHTFGFGNNSQNFPKHNDIASMYRRCLVARPGNILLMVDQISAEDWPVSALSQNHQSLAELSTGVDRHTKLASAIFNISITSRTPEQWKESIERYLGKKVRHASNYDMTAPRMSEALIQEGKVYTVPECQVLLDRMSAIDPSVKNIFHKYVQDTINRTHMLVTPFGRERQFLSARPGDNNATVFKEAYAFIPQSTIGDNTGFAVLQLETLYPLEERYVIQEGHDSIVQDIQDSPESIYKSLLRVHSAFDRSIRFYNGIEVRIPIEAELGYDFATTVKIKDFNRAGVAEAREKLRDKVGKVAVTKYEQDTEKVMA
jgi:DNA polymerase family A